MTVRGGTSTSRTVSDRCEIRAAVPESAPLDPYCHVSSGARTQIRSFAAYVMRRADLQIGAVYQNQPGPQLIANTSVFSGVGFGLVGINIIEPGTLYGERVSELDLRVAKGLRLGRARPRRNRFVQRVQLV